MAQDPEILSGWFELYSRIKNQYNIRNRDIYNMDEKGFLQGRISKLKVVISKHLAKQHITQDGSRE